MLSDGLTRIQLKAVADGDGGAKNMETGLVRLVWAPTGGVAARAQGQPLPPQISRRLWQKQAKVWNGAGLYCFQAQDYEKALHLFQAAVARDVTDTDYFKNVMHTWARVNRPQEALAYLEASPPRGCAANDRGGNLKLWTRLKDYPSQPDLLSWQAFLQGEDGKIALAATNYAKLFASGYRNEDDLTDRSQWRR